MASEEEQERATKRARRQGRVIDLPGGLESLSSANFAAAPSGDSPEAESSASAAHASLTQGPPSWWNEDSSNLLQDGSTVVPQTPFTPGFGGQFYRSLELSETDNDAVMHDSDNIDAHTPSTAKTTSAKDRDPSEPFNLFTSLVQHPEIVLIIAKHLTVSSLVSLYAMSREFHDLMNQRFVTMVLSQAVPKAKDSACIFHWKNYPSLCQSDPAPRNVHPYPPLAEQGRTRDIPTFRWLRMVIFREKVCHEIMVIMAEDGVRLPQQCEQTLKKLWYLMDLPDNVRRIGLIHNKRFFQDFDLFMLTMFEIKLDMRFTDPVEGMGTSHLRKMLLAQSSLSTLWKALKRTALKSQFDVLKMFVRWKYAPPSEEAGMSIFGIPPEEIGMVQYEWHGRNGRRTLLMQPDELVMRECVRRKIDLRPHIKQMLVWGYIDPLTMKDHAPKKWDRKVEALKDDYEGDDPDLGDHILDLGVMKQISQMVLRD